MKKFLLSILLCAGIFCNVSPMKRQRETECPQNEIVLVDGKPTFDYSKLLNWLLGEKERLPESLQDVIIPSEIIILIICQLDGASFSALTSTSKNFQFRCDNIPTEYLPFTCAYVAYHGNAQLTIRFLIAANECKGHVDKTLFVPLLVEEVGAAELSFCKLEMFKILIANQPIYKTTYKADRFDDISMYKCFINLGNQNFVSFVLAPCQLQEVSKLWTMPDLEKLAAFAKPINDDLQKRSISSEDFTISLHAVELAGQAYGLSQPDGKDYFCMTSHKAVNMIKQQVEPSQDEFFISFPCFQGPNSDRARTLFLSMHIMCIIAACKNCAAVVKVFLEEISLSSDFLKFVAHLTTSDEIKEMIRKEIGEIEDIENQPADPAQLEYL